VLGIFFAVVLLHPVVCNTSCCNLQIHKGCNQVIFLVGVVQVLEGLMLVLMVQSLLTLLHFDSSFLRN